MAEDIPPSPSPSPSSVEGSSDITDPSPSLEGSSDIKTYTNSMVDATTKLTAQGLKPTWAQEYAEAADNYRQSLEKRVTLSADLDKQCSNAYASKELKAPSVPSPSSEASSDIKRSEGFAEAAESMLEAASILTSKGLKAMRAREFAKAADYYRQSLKKRIMAAEFVKLDAYADYGIVLLYKATTGAGKPEPASQHPVSGVARIEVDSDAETDTELLKKAGAQPDIIEIFKILFTAYQISKSMSGAGMQGVDILAELGTKIFLHPGYVRIALIFSVQAFSLLKDMAQLDDILITSLGVTICRILAHSGHGQDAIPYCQKAISISKSYLEFVTNEVSSSSESATTSFIAQQKNKRIESLQHVSELLEKELERLQQHGNAVSRPTTNDNKNILDIAARISDLIAACKPLGVKRAADASEFRSFSPRKKPLTSDKRDGNVS